MNLEQKRVQENFLILPEPAYSAEGLNGISGLRAPPPKEEQEGSRAFVMRYGGIDMLILPFDLSPANRLWLRNGNF